MSKITNRQQAVLEWLRLHQPCSNAQIAERFQIAPATVTVHLMFLSQAGLAWSTGRGGHARWHADKPEPKRKFQPDVLAPVIEQVSSVWHYARRCARDAGAA